MVNKTYIVYQNVVVKQEMAGYNNNVEMAVIVRRVKAKSEAEAIGKFILNTSNEIYQQKLEPCCIELTNLKLIE